MTGIFQLQSGTVDETKRHGEEQIYNCRCCEPCKEDWQRRVALALFPHVDTNMEETVVCPISPFGFGTEATDEMKKATNDGDEESRSTAMGDRLMPSDEEM